MPHSDPIMPDLAFSSPPDPALALVLEGWNHLKRQLPLAAWACWRRALRLEPEQKAATHALHILANAPDLPAAARAEYRFLTPTEPAQRARWDGELRSRDLGDLAVAAGAFARLAGPIGGDGRARFNEGLCLAWLGRNAEAVAALDSAVGMLAEAEPGVAVDAWTLAEVLRQGAGAEVLADDRNYVTTLTRTRGGEGAAGFLDDHPAIRPIPTPVDPTTGAPARADLDLFEWLDVAHPAPSGAIPLQATVVRTPEFLRLSGPDPARVEAAAVESARRLDPDDYRLDRAVTLQPLAFLDAAVWAIRLPAGIDPEQADAANRAQVERYYESAWITQPRSGLDGQTPLEAGRRALAGDLILGAKLAAVIRLREQLGARPSTARLYQGYPFDRLRRRLGLPPVNPDAVDPGDAATMSAADLDALDPKAMTEHDLVDAFESAAALGEDARTARFAAWLADLDPARSAEPLRRADLSAVFAVLVRQALLEDDADLALEWTDRAVVVDQALHGGRAARGYRIWRAEIEARTGRPAAALLTYRALIAADPAAGAAVALDGAEFLLDNEHDEQARTLVALAADLAEQADDRPLMARAAELMDLL